MKKAIFGKWKKDEAVIGNDDDGRHREGKIILERMASIISSDEAKINERQDALLFEASTGDLSSVGDKSETKALDTASMLETSNDNLITIKNLEANTSPLTKEGTAADGNEICATFQNTKPLPESISNKSSHLEKNDFSVILVVKDEPVTQRLLKKILEDRGYEVVLAGDGIDALMELGKRKFDLILSDLSMPNLDGFKLFDFINMKGFQTPIIFLTGSDEVEDEIKVLALGAKDYIRKPLNRDLLLLRVSKVLHK